MSTAEPPNSPTSLSEQARRHLNDGRACSAAPWIARAASIIFFYISWGLFCLSAISVGVTFLETGRLGWEFMFLQSSAATFLIFASLPAVTLLTYFLNVLEPRGPRWLPWMSLFVIGVILLLTPFLVAGYVTLAIGPLWLLTLYGVVAKPGRAGPAEAIPERVCSSCGYNLRGNASGRCPECGKRILNKVFY